MGNFFGSPINNEEMVWDLAESRFISSPYIRCIFRAVDRGLFCPLPVTGNILMNPYQITNFRWEKVNVSAPCVYATAIEAFQIEPGMSFLNLGSGTGYFNTLVGLILGSYGVNHGVEPYIHVMEYAKERVEVFMRSSWAVDAYDFCKPQFLLGNYLWMDNNLSEYDRVFCDGVVLPEYEMYLKGLIKVGGILIMGMDGMLVKIKRTAPEKWRTTKLITAPMLPITYTTDSFAVTKTVPTGDSSPPSLKDICRRAVRNWVKSTIKVSKSHPLNQTRMHGVVPKLPRPKSSEQEYFRLLARSHHTYAYDPESPEDYFHGCITKMVDFAINEQKKKHDKNTKFIEAKISFITRNGEIISEPSTHFDFVKLRVTSFSEHINQPPPAEEVPLKYEMESQNACAQSRNNKRKLAEMEGNDASTSTGSAAGPAAGSRAGPPAGPRAVPAAGPRAVPAAGPRAVPAAGPRAVPGVGPRAVPGAGPRPVPGAGPRAVPGAGPRPVPGAGPRPVPGAGPRPVPGAGPRPVPGAGHRPVPGAGPRAGRAAGPRAGRAAALRAGRAAAIAAAAVASKTDDGKTQTITTIYNKRCRRMDDEEFISELHSYSIELAERIDNLILPVALKKYLNYYRVFE